MPTSLIAFRRLIDILKTFHLQTLTVGVSSRFDLSHTLRVSL